MRLLGLAFFALLVPSIAAAQNSGIFVQAGPLLDIRATSSVSISESTNDRNTYAWNDINGDRLWQPGEESVIGSDGLSPMSDDRFAPGASAAIGVFLSPSISLRLEGSFQGEHVSTSETTTAGLLLSSRQTASAADLIVGAGWHQGGQRRTTITYVAGMMFRRRQDETTVTQSFNFPGLPPLIGLGGRPVATLGEQTLSRTSYGAGVMAGLDVTIAVSTHFAIVPQVRMVAADGDWNVRPGVALRWRP